MTASALEAPLAVGKAKVPTADLQRGASLEFVKFCKDYYARAQAAETFLRMLHNHNWQLECDRIRQAMLPEIDKLFAPIETEIARGANYEEVFKQLVKALKSAD